MKDCIVSVIMPLYNAEETLRDSVGSVLAQTLGFEDHIEILLVDDGSRDGTWALCEEYQAAWPGNIRCFAKENGGVSSARNYGIPYARGKYITFLDKDDSWEEHAFARLVKFFDRHYDEIDECVAKIENTGDLTSEEHPLNFKFEKGSRVIDLIREPECINHTIGNVMVKAEAITDIRFDEDLNNGEDAKFANTVVLAKLRYGVVANALFRYRRMKGGGSLSGALDKGLYTHVPGQYYLDMIRICEEKLGTVPQFVQHALLYNMRWRRYMESVFLRMTEEEIQGYLEDMKQVFRKMDDEVIVSAEGHNPYRLLYFLELKYGEDPLKDAVLRDGCAWRGDGSLRLMDYADREVFLTEVLYEEEEGLNIQGLFWMHLPKNMPYELVLKDRDGFTYYVETVPYPQEDLIGFIGEHYEKAFRYDVTVPLEKGASYTFLIRTAQGDFALDPTYRPNTLMQEYTSHPYRRMGDYILKDQGKKLLITSCNPVKLAGTEGAFTLRQLANRDAWSVGQRAIYDYTYLTASRGKLRNAPLFLTIRNNGAPEGNLAELYDAYPEEKTLFAKRTPFGWKDILRACKAIYHHKVVVTDDYMYLFRRYPKREGQFLIQIWHACGAFKKFGLDGTNIFPALDANTHKGYDLVSVSAEHLRDIYAGAFGVPVEKVRALGVPRTDLFFDEARMEKVRAAVYEAHPELLGKEVLLYAPTFRDIPDIPRQVFLPDLDFDELSRSLKEDQVLVICPHPVMTERILPEKYDNILEVRDTSTMDMMLVSDLLITDYSSVIFEYSLLDKPIVFYCYDYDSYERDFYLDYEKDLPGELLRTQEELTAYLRQDSYAVSEKQDAFVTKYMGACDGHSTERLIAVIREQLL